MKRFLFLAVLMSMFAIGNVSAQVISYSQTKVTKLEKERKPVELRQFAGAEFGTYPKDQFASMTLGAYYEIGAMFNKSIFLGGGFGLGSSCNGLNFPTTLGLNEGWSGYNYTEFTAKGIAIKAYVDTKFYLTKTKLKPYFDLSIGGVGCKGYEYSYYLSDNMYYLRENEIRKYFIVDLFANPQFGLDYQLGRNVKSIFVNAGYCLPLFGMLDGFANTEGFRVKLGITF